MPKGTIDKENVKGKLSESWQQYLCVSVCVCVCVCVTRRHLH